MADIAQVNQALNLTNQLIAELDQAERQLSSARNWGFLDVLGGGLIVDLIKHSKLNNAKVSMDRVQYYCRNCAVCSVESLCRVIIQ